MCSWQLPLHFFIFARGTLPNAKPCAHHVYFGARTSLLDENRDRSPCLCLEMANHERNRKILLELLKQPCNSRCADCNAPGKKEQTFLDIIPYKHWGNLRTETFELFLEPASSTCLIVLKREGSRQSLSSWSVNVGFDFEWFCFLIQWGFVSYFFDTIIGFSLFKVNKRTVKT